MGYIDTILGYGSNHMHVPLRMLFSKIIRDGNLEIALDEEVVLEALKHGSLEAHLQDDLFLEDAPDERVLIIESEDDLYEAFSGSYVSKDYGCRFGRGCCFQGIIIDDCNIIKSTRVNSNEIEDLENRIMKAKKWVSELKEQKRLLDDIKLVMTDNCCS